MARFVEAARVRTERSGLGLRSVLPSSLRRRLGLSSRSTSADGWTRVIELTVGLHEPLRWLPFQEQLEALLKVLTGDYWKLHFVAGGAAPPDGRPVATAHDCVSLLSGGLDSLIGGIDLVAGRRPMFVSQLAHGDSQRQRNYAAQLGGVGLTGNGAMASALAANVRLQRALGLWPLRVRGALPRGLPPILSRCLFQKMGFICINPPFGARTRL